MKDELTHCLNLCISNGNFPASMKIAKVTPIFKSGNKENPGDYRPVSVLPVTSKILERILHTRLASYLDSTNFLYERQYGFRPKSNTLSATIDLTTQIKLSIDGKNIVLGIFIDLKKAFDTVSHSILLKKLKGNGVTGTAYEMFQSYLTNRYQIVKIDNFESILNSSSVECHKDPFWDLYFSLFT